MSSDSFVHGERELALEFGVQQRNLRVVRADDLARDADWSIVEGKVMYSAAGVAKLRRLLKITSEKAPAGAVPPLLAPPPAELKIDEPHDLSMLGILRSWKGKRRSGAIEDLVCTRVYKINKRIVEAVTAAGEPVVVRVKDSANLLPKMTMKCRFGAGRVWELAQRLPRRRGRW